MENVIWKIIKLASNKAVEKKHDRIHTGHLFIATNIFLKQIFVKGSPEQHISPTKYDIPLLKEKYDKYIKLREEYNLLGKPLEEVYNKMFPMESNTSGICSKSAEFQLIESKLRNIQKQKNVLTINDFILELFWSKDYSLFDLIAEASGSREKADEFYEKVRELFYMKAISTYSELDKIPYMTNLNDWVTKNPRIVVNVDTEVNKIFMGLSGRSVSSVLVRGPAGSGKTEVVYELAQRINDGNCPEQFKEKIIYGLDPTGLVAGARYRGETEGRLMAILEFVKSNKDIILFIDEVHQMVGLGNSSPDGESGGGSDILKPYLSRGDIQIIGATTDEEAEKYVMKSKAFARRLFPVHIQEPSLENTKIILNGVKPSLEKYFEKDTQDDILDKVLEFSSKYNLEQANPAKSISILEMAMVYSRLFKEKNMPAGIDDVLKAISLKYDVYISENRLDDTEAELRKMVLGQEKAIDEIVNSLALIEANVIDDDRPQGVVVFSGSTGSGKTFSCELIAEKFYGHKNNLIKVNCSEFSNSHDVSKILG